MEFYSCDPPGWQMQVRRARPLTGRLWHLNFVETRGVARSLPHCTTGMPGFDLRQGQSKLAKAWASSIWSGPIQRLPDLTQSNDLPRSSEFGTLKLLSALIFEVTMVRAVFKGAVSGAFLLVLLPVNGAQAFGDEPRWPGFGYGYEPAIASGCWKWNWQQYSWYDHCPAYVHPKAYMYSRPSSRTVLRTKG